MQYWTAEAIYEVKCPQCNAMVEFYKDDTTRKCSHCGHRFVNPRMDFGCASYCQFAEQCLGTLPEGFTAQRDDLLKDRVAVEMKRYFKNDFKMISHASRVARYAERMGKIEGGNPAVLLCASYLLHIGYPEAARKYGEIEAKNHLEQEGIPVAEEILKRLGANEHLLASVCAIIDGHPGPDNIKEFSLVRDADLLASMEEQYKDVHLGPVGLCELSERLHSKSARQQAEELAARLAIRAV